MTTFHARESIEAYPEATPYDTALPQEFVDEMRKRGFEAFGQFVWSYANGSWLGFPYPLNASAVRALITYVREGGPL